ncbi:MAG: hypothetical protein PHC29_08420 [Candidatus Omnitrophica bacterium]|nr:hypothetical protein [Candidatus Omnitrophota bacterium]
MDNDIGFQSRDIYEEPRVRSDEEVDPTEELRFPIKDDDLLKIVKNKIASTENYYNQIKLTERRKENYDFYKGIHFDETQFEDYQVPYKDNIIWRNLETRISIASGRMPDIIVTPANKSSKARELGKEIEKALDARINSDFTQRLIKDGLRYNHLDFIGAIKVRWDANMGEGGDFRFDLVRPKFLGVDPYATISHDGFTADNFNYIYEYIEEPARLVLAKFPKKRRELLEMLNLDEDSKSLDSSLIKYLEFWFTYYDDKGIKKEAVASIYKNIVLDVNDNPYWDWEGIDKVSENLNQNGEYDVTRYFQNYFQQPRKPYIILSHQNIGEGPIDTTTPVEQAIGLQKIINKRGRQITEISDRSVPKLVFSTQYIKQSDIELISQDPTEHIALDATRVNEAFGIIPATPPNPILYNDLVANRAEVDSMFATHGTTRGEVQSNESGISKQITREGDLTIADDIVNIVVERVVYEMSSWALQMMKLFYDKEHYVRNVGKDGEIIEVELSQDKIEDGIEVSVKSSSTEKAERKGQALEMAGMKLIDPLTLFEDLDAPNPRERTERLMTFLLGETDGFATYMSSVGIDMEKITGKKETGNTAGGGAEKAQADIEAILSGEEVEVSGVPDEEYLTAIQAFIQSPEFENADEESKQRLIAHIQKLKAGLDQIEQPPQEGGENVNI